MERTLVDRRFTISDIKATTEDIKMYGAHLCMVDGYYYKTLKVSKDNPNGGKKKYYDKYLLKRTYDELDESEKQKIEEVKAKDEEMKFYKEVLTPAKEKFKAYVRENGTFICQSNQSESEYYRVKGVDGLNYKVRISGHFYPTGSMTDLSMQVIDTTDYDCREFCKIVGI